MSSKSTEFKRIGHEERSNTSSEILEKEGYNSSNIQFIRALCNPKGIISRKNGKRQYLIVGYEFKSLADEIKVPVYPIEKEGFNIVNSIPSINEIDANDIKFKVVHKDEVFHLNTVETAIFFSSIEIAGKVCGGNGSDVVLSVTWRNDEPVPVLRKADGTSIREGEYTILNMDNLYEASEVGYSENNGYKYAKLDKTYEDICFLGGAPGTYIINDRDINNPIYVKVCGRAINVSKGLTLAEIRALETPKVYSAAFRKLYKQAEKIDTSDINTDQMKKNGVEERSQYMVEEKELEGIKSDKIMFLNCILNPKFPTHRLGKDKKPIKSYKVCGYEFKALEDIEVPVEPQCILKGIRDADFENVYESNLTNQTRHVKAGEVFHLNLRESAVLISRLEYAGRIKSDYGSDVVLAATYSLGIVIPVLKFDKKAAGSLSEHAKYVVDMSTEMEDGMYRIAKLDNAYSDLVPSGSIVEKNNVNYMIVGKASKDEGNGGNDWLRQPERDYAASFRKIFESKRVAR